MQRRYYIQGAGVVLSGLLLAACAIPPARRAGLAEAPARPLPVQSTNPTRDTLAEAHAHYASAIIHEMNDEGEAALGEYFQAALGDPSNEWLVLDVSRRLLQNKQFEKALELLTRAAAQPQAAGAIFARLGLVDSQLGKYEDAAAADRTAIKRSPESLTGYQNLFYNCVQNKQLPEALQVLDEAARQPTQDPDFFINLGELYVNYALQVPSQKPKVQPKILAVLHRAEKLNPASPPLRLRLADAFNAAGDQGSATRIYLELLRKLPDVPLFRERVHAKLADIYLRSHDHKQAIEQLQAIVHDDPTNPEANYYLGYLAYDEKKFPDAVEYFRKTILLNPNFPDAYYDLALAYLDLNKPDEALATLSQARQRFPKNFVMEYWTALACIQKKAYAEALPHFTEAEVIAQATYPKGLDEGFFFQVGAAYERTGNLAQAEAYFQKCLERAPDFAEAQNYLGYMWAEHGMNLADARKLIEKAVKAQPKNAAYLDSLGWVLFKLDQPKEGLEYILKAVELSKEPDATVFDHLGDIYAALHQPDKARDAWGKSLALEPNEQVRKKLEPAAEK